MFQSAIVTNGYYQLDPYFTFEWL